MKTKPVIFWGIIIFLALAAFVGCKSQARLVEVPVETVKTQYINKVSLDSVYLRDSIYIFSKNDTVYSNKYTYLYRNKFRTDTIYRDSIKQVPIRVELPAEQVPVYPKWLVILAVAGGIAIGWIGFKFLKPFF